MLIIIIFDLTPGGTESRTPARSRWFCEAVGVTNMRVVDSGVELLLLS